MELSPRRILIVRLTALGDVISALPALTALRNLFPDSHIAWAVEPPADELLEGHPHLDEVIVVPRREWQSRLKRPWSAPSAIRQAIAAAKALSRKEFDLAVDFQGNLRSGIITLASRAPVRLGLSRKHVREFANHFANVWFEPASPRLHRVDLPLAMLRILGDVPESVEPVLPHYLRADLELEAEFAKEELPTDFVLLHPGTSPFGVFKQWPISSFGILALKLSEQRSLDVLVSWGPGEKELAGKVVDASRGAARLAPETPTLQHMAELIRRCKVFVAADTGPLHMAWALGKPLVGLYGPKDEELHAPRGPNSRIVTAQVDCRPCTRRRCKNPICMSQIPPDSVFSALTALLM